MNQAIKYFLPRYDQTASPFHGSLIDFMVISQFAWLFRYFLATPCLLVILLSLGYPLVSHGGVFYVCGHHVFVMTFPPASYSPFQEIFHTAHASFGDG